MTSLNCCKGIIPILYILKNSWTRDGLTWSNSMELHCNSDNKSQCYIEIFDVGNRWKCKNKANLLVKLHYCCEELHQATFAIKHKIVHTYVPIHIKWMHFLYIWEPSLKSMVHVLDVEHFPKQRLEIWVSLEEFFKSIILFLPKRPP